MLLLAHLSSKQNKARAFCDVPDLAEDPACSNPMRFPIHTFAMKASESTSVMLSQLPPLPKSQSRKGLKSDNCDSRPSDKRHAEIKNTV